MLTVGTFKVTTQAKTTDPKAYAQEQAAKGNWKPTDRLLSKADPDFIQRWFILEAKKIALRKLWNRAALIQRKVENGTSFADRMNQDAIDFWMEYAALDSKWIGDVQDIKNTIRKENNGSL